MTYKSGINMHTKKQNMKNQSNITFSNVHNSLVTASKNKKVLEMLEKKFKTNF
jgi:uncharacterized lipoprotein